MEITPGIRFTADQTTSTLAKLDQHLRNGIFWTNLATSPTASFSAPSLQISGEGSRTMMEAVTNAVNALPHGPTQTARRSCSYGNR